MGFLQPEISDFEMSEREDELEQQTIELHFQEAMYKMQKKNTTLQPNGFCYNCDENVEGTRAFCDEDCRDDYTKRKHAESNRLY